MNHVTWFPEQTYKKSSQIQGTSWMMELGRIEAEMGIILLREQELVHSGDAETWGINKEELDEKGLGSPSCKDLSGKAKIQRTH